MRLPRFPRLAPVALVAGFAVLTVGCIASPAPATAPSTVAVGGAAPTGSPPAAPTVAPAVTRVGRLAEVATIKLTSSVGLVRPVGPEGDAQVPIGQGAVQVVVRRLFVDPGVVRVHAQPADGAPAGSPAWQVQMEEPPAPGTLAFQLHSGRPGRVAVTLEAPGWTPVRFIVEVTELPIVQVLHSSQVLRLSVGERFILDASFDHVFHARAVLTDPSVPQLVRQRDDGVPVVSPVHRPIHLLNEYQAVRPGRTVLRAEGHCLESEGCGWHGGEMRFQVVVEVR
jgi:hypothetical protein